ncbi:MAG: hypothetical protein ABI599_04955 [Flavobacteriales bacterium]
MRRNFDQCSAGPVLAMLLASTPASAQLMGAAFSSVGTDHSWERSGVSGGLLVEGRTHDSAWYVLRGSAAYTWPSSWSTASRYVIPGNPPNEVLEIHRYDLQRVHVAADMKVPYGCMFCPHGYFRGGYLMIGAGWTHSWLRDERTNTESTGNLQDITTTKASYDQALLRLTGGAEINGPWGGVFGELMFTAANSILSYPQHIVFVNTLTATVGYRFSLKHTPQARTED